MAYHAQVKIKKPVSILLFEFTMHLEALLFNLVSTNSLVIQENKKSTVKLELF